jgi:hypothetical protein
MRKRTLTFQPYYNEEEEEDVQMEDVDDDDVSSADALVEKRRQSNNKRRSICGRYEKRIPEDVIEDNLEVVRDSSVEDPLEDFLSGFQDGSGGGGDVEGTETILPDLLEAEEGDGLCCKQEEAEDRGQQERQVQMVWVAAEGEEEEEEDQRAYSSDVLTRQPEITFTGT